MLHSWRVENAQHGILRGQEKQSVNAEGNNWHVVSHHIGACHDAVPLQDRRLQFCVEVRSPVSTKDEQNGSNRTEKENQ